MRLPYISEENHDEDPHMEVGYLYRLCPPTALLYCALFNRAAAALLALLPFAQGGASRAQEAGRLAAAAGRMLSALPSCIRARPQVATSSEGPAAQQLKAAILGSGKKVGGLSSPDSAGL